MTTRLTFRLLLVTCIFSLAFGVGGNAPRAEHMDVDEMVKFFDDVVFKSTPSNRLLKWTKGPIIRLETLSYSENDYDTPVRVETSKADYEFVAKHIENLSQLTGLQIRLLPRDLGEGGDIVVTIVPWHLVRKTSVNDAPESLLRKLMGPGRCFFVLWPSSENAIVKARIIINSSLEKDHIRHCFLEEITQSFGLPYDSDRVRPSIFNESSRQPRLSIYDEALIHTVYDPSLTIGMPRADVLDRARVVIESQVRQTE